MCRRQQGSCIQLRQNGSVAHFHSYNVSTSTRIVHPASPERKRCALPIAKCVDVNEDRASSFARTPTLRTSIRKMCRRQQGSCIQPRQNASVAQFHTQNVSTLMRIVHPASPERKRCALPFVKCVDVNKDRASSLVCVC